MTAQRIHLTGASGSGTTTLGRALAQGTGCAQFDADQYYWEPTDSPFQVVRSKPERLRLFLPELARVPAFVLSGSIVGWGPALEDRFDLIVFLTIPSEIRLARLRAREIERYGKVNEAFIAWTARHDDGGMETRSRFKHEHWLAQRRCPILRLDGDHKTEDRLQRVLQALRP